MTISSIGSTFSYIPPAMAVADTAPKARIAEASEASASKDDSRDSGGSEQKSSAQSAPVGLRSEAAEPAAAVVVAVQARAPVAVAPRQAAAAYDH